jgi:hypothetical protein
MLRQPVSRPIPSRRIHHPDVVNGRGDIRAIEATVIHPSACAPLARLQDSQ